jgi:hypothetical protein
MIKKWIKNIIIECLAITDRPNLTIEIIQNEESKKEINVVIRECILGSIELIDKKPLVKIKGKNGNI